MWNHINIEKLNKSEETHVALHNVKVWILCKPKSWCLILQCKLIFMRWLPVSLPMTGVIVNFEGIQITAIVS